MRMRGVISNRILLNYRCAPEVSAALLPAGLRPWLQLGQSIVGVCLIELKGLRPSGLPLPQAVGAGSMNAGYRIAVEWARHPAERGVYLSRRDTDSRITAWLGGRAFPGLHHHSRFETSWTDDHASITIQSNDGQADLFVTGTVCDRIAPDSVFADLAAVSTFFRDADRGFSPGRHRTEGLRLHVGDWQVRGFALHELHAAYFTDHSRFPIGSLTFDSAVFMSDVEHEWEVVEPPIP